MTMNGFTYDFRSFREEEAMRQWHANEAKRNRDLALKRARETGDIVDAEFEVVEPLKLDHKPA